MMPILRYLLIGVVRATIATLQINNVKEQKPSPELAGEGV
jgi:hypothetical protein